MIEIQSWSSHLKRDKETDPLQIDAKPKMSFACSFKSIPTL